ncbi:hypothetical protein C7I87_28250 [Mesorhizobium sp. SARCC-RB16n]|nr:hypothetical protein C7I87_28250 [Mesorhizobium sp. SARCC-RB16n]
MVRYTGEERPKARISKLAQRHFLRHQCQKRGGARLATRRTALPPSSLEETLFLIVELPDEQFARLKECLTSELSFALPRAVVSALGQDLGLSERQISYLANSLAYLYVAAQDSPLAHNDAAKALVRDLDLSALPQPEAALFSTRLLELISKSSAHDAYRKREMLKGGILPAAVDLKTLVDLRPDFGDDKETPVPKSFVISIQLRISTDSRIDQNRDLTCHLTEDVLDDFIAKLQRTKRKIDALKDFASSSSLAVR